MRSRWYRLSRAARAAHQLFSGHGHALEAGLLGARERNRTQRPSTEQPEVPPWQPVSSVRAATSPPRTHPLGLSSLLQWCCDTSSGWEPSCKLEVDDGFSQRCRPLPNP